MRRTVLVLPLALTLVFAGCIGPSATTAPTDTATPTDASPSNGPATPTPTDEPTDADGATATPTPPSENVSVTYELRAGGVPDELQSVTLTARVVFVENDRDMGPCWRDTFHGPYKPTPTPVPTPSGECYRSSPVTLDLPTLENGTSLGPVTARGSVDAGHALVVTDVRATFENGTETSAIKGVGGHVASVVEGPPEGPYRVDLSIERAPEGAAYEYVLVSERANAND